MRNTSFDLDQDSTIISMLSMPELRGDTQPSKAPLSFKVLLGCIALFLLIVYLSGVLS